MSETFHHRSNAEWRTFKFTAKCRLGKGATAKMQESRALRKSPD